MAVPPYMEVHVPEAITEQLRRRGGWTFAPLPRTVVSGCPTNSYWSTPGNSAEFCSRRTFGSKRWPKTGSVKVAPLAALFSAINSTAPSGSTVQDLELIAQASEPGEWVHTGEH